MPEPTPLYREFLTQDEIDRQYNPSLPPAEPQAAVKHWLQQARRARNAPGAQLDVPYGPTLAETLDIFPAAQPAAPVFIFFHGGYWRSFHARDFSGLSLGAQAAGITTVMVNYALCPHVSLDEIGRQARASVAWVLRHIHEYGGDSARVAVGGHSAGGQLAAMCLNTAWARDYGLPEQPLRAGWLASGLYELEPLRYSYLQPQIQLDEGLVRRNSPLRHARDHGAAVRMVWGARESTEFARQTQTMAQAWQACGVTAQALAVADADHFTVLQGLDEAGSADVQWLRAALG